MAGNPQPPTVYLDGNDINGPAKLCYNNSGTYSFGSCKSTPVQSWEYSTNLLNLVSSNSTSITVQPKNSSSSGLGYIRAVYPYQTVQKNIWIGKPNFSFNLDWDAAARMVTVTAVGPSGSDISAQGITSMNWQVIGTSGGGYAPRGSCSGFECHARGPANSNNWSVDFKVNTNSSCGTTINYITATPPPPLNSKASRKYNFVSNPYNVYTINYIKEGVSVPVENIDSPNQKYKIIVYNFTGNPVMETTETKIDISKLKTVIYILKAIIDDNVLTKKVIK